MRRISDELNSERLYEPPTDYSNDKALIDIYTYKDVVKVRYGSGRRADGAFMFTEDGEEYIRESSYAIRETVGSSFGFHANKYLSSYGQMLIGGKLILNLCFIHIFRDTSRDVFRDYIMEVLLKDGSSFSFDFKYGLTYTFEDGTYTITDGYDIKNLNGFFIRG
jgi:hypothetical protein